MKPISRIFHRSKGASSEQENVEHGREINEEGKLPVAGDNPITVPEDDTLGRADLAQSFAQRVLTLDSRQGVVVGVLGAWGTGKTSFINLARIGFDQAHVPVLDSNPWMFSGAEQLVSRFFTELAAQLELRPALTDIAQDIFGYGEALSGLAVLPGFSPWAQLAGGASKGISKTIERRREGIGGRRARLQKALAKLTLPIVVVIDDIDRLSSSEIREVFKLVRLTASFPRIVYIVAFDRLRVEKALNDEGIPGRDYLEKILQVAVDLPSAPPQLLHRQILNALDDALTGIDNPGPFDSQLWPDLFMEVVRPLIRNIRDVRRYAASVRGAVSALNGKIALADVLALEAVRTFLPDVYYLLHGAVATLTTAESLSFGSNSEDLSLKASVEALIRASGSHEAVVRALIGRLFPAAARHIGGSHYTVDWKGRWLRERRVAHEEILSLYLEGVAGVRLQAFASAEQAFALMADQTAFDNYLRSLDAERLEDVIASLELWEGDFSPVHVVPGTIVLLNLLGTLPRRDRGMFELDARLTVGRVTYRLLSSLKDPAQIEAAVRQILPELASLYSKLEVIEDVGYRKGAGHRLVSEAAAAEFERNWRQDVRSTKPSDLERERDLLRLLIVAKEETEPDEDDLLIPEDARLTLAILETSRNDVRSQIAGSRAVRRSPRLAWDALITLFGDADALAARVDQLRTHGLSGQISGRLETESF
jgi:predicted KAP-like P-loop ATPase